MAALQYADQPGYSALLLRQTYPELSQPGGLMDRAHEWLAGKARWNETERVWTFPSGAKLAFGYLQHSTDRYRYQGSEWDFVGFDELTHFTEEDYRYMFSRLRRREGSQIPPRMRGASNPGNRGHRWVKERFIDHPVPGRLFIPASLHDNPGVDQEGYLRALQQLSPEEFEQLANGDWSVRPPGDWVFDHHGIDAAVEMGRKLDAQREQGKLPDPTMHLGARRVTALAIGVDWGDFATRGHVGWGLERGGLYVPPGAVSSSRADVEDISNALLASAAGYPFWLAEERYDASFAQSNRTFRRIAEQRLGPHNPVKCTGRPNTYPVPFAEYKELTVKYLRLLMRRSLAEEETRILAISPDNAELIEQLRDLQEDEQGKILKGDDDSVDSLITLAAPLARRHRQVVELEIEQAKRRQDEANKRMVDMPPGVAEVLEVRG
jgi:hypothetical protein